MRQVSRKGSLLAVRAPAPKPSNAARAPSNSAPAVALHAVVTIVEWRGSNGGETQCALWI